MTAAQWRQGLNGLLGGYLSPKAKFAIKVSLSLTLAYIIPMAFGWSQPSTAAMTVMLIVATGGMRESLLKGTYRVIGTLIGMVIGVGLIILLSGHTALYFLAVSLVVAIVFYIYRCCQGDNTVFMLTGVMVMMSYNGGDFDGSLLYGIERAYMTTFGIVVYTLIGSFIWPTKPSLNIRQTVTTLSEDYCQLFSTLRQSSANDKARAQLAAIVSKTEALQQQLITMRADAGEANALRKHWQMIAQHYQDISSRLTNVMDVSQQHNSASHLPGEQHLLDIIESQLSAIHSCWQGGQQKVDAIDRQTDQQQWQTLPHFEAAQRIARGEWLASFSQLLSALNQTVLSLNSGDQHFDYQPRSKAASFIWLDRESFKLGAMAFITYWLAHSLWFFFNPPGGYSFVTFATMFVPLVGFTPIKPKLLFLLFTFAFLFAGLAYVFILPGLSHWSGLFIFIFVYAFIGFYLLPGPVTMFFLLGLFVLGIDNQMQYNFAVILTVMLMLYLAVSVLFITTYLPFNSKPEYLYRSMRQRFFAAANVVLRYQGKSLNHWQKKHLTYAASACVRLNHKMKTWSASIDYSYFTELDQQSINELNESMAILSGRLQLLMQRRESFNNNRLIQHIRQSSDENFLQELCAPLRHSVSRQISTDSKLLWPVYEQKINALLAPLDWSIYNKQEIAEFYLGINLYKNIMSSLMLCDQRIDHVNWTELSQSRF
ncbi:putative membrane protein YccC [Sinobacterium caligoides]|uniref:Putative membrane protein YccC n=1 Tax=Sinobacterium caligoides TaxID=933926 RepID=A0A3N2DK11_9GAMM|nr:FUSC family protein [Sinobacterium caligoides]ROS00140.1 putative membrane protein YccC [Sinobacterium caligoides]